MMIDYIHYSLFEARLMDYHFPLIIWMNFVYRHNFGIVKNFYTLLHLHLLYLL